MRLLAVHLREGAGATRRDQVKLRLWSMEGPCRLPHEVRLHRVERDAPDGALVEGELPWADRWRNARIGRTALFEIVRQLCLGGERRMHYALQIRGWPSRARP